MLAVVSAGIQVVGVELVEAGTGKAQAMGSELGCEIVSSEGGQNVTDQGRSTAMNQLSLLSFSIGERSRSRWGCLLRTTSR
jgi:hypothetical protein